MIHGVYFDDTVKGEDVSPTVMRRWNDLEWHEGVDPVEISDLFNEVFFKSDG